MALVKYLALIAALALAAPPGAAAHEIPASVTVHLFVKPEGERLRVLARVPLAALRDADVPTRGPGYLDVDRARPALRGAAVTWVGNGLRIFEQDRPLPRPRLAALQISLPSDRSFGRYEEALAHVLDARAGGASEIYWNQALVDVLFEYSIASERSAFALESDLARLGVRVVTVVRFVQPDGAVRAFEFAGSPGLLRLDPRWHHAARRFAMSGFLHILDGIDHLLFLVCLVIPLRRVMPLVGVVTAFTAAHSVTLIASAAGLAPGALWFPPLVETLIAGSIVYMALENIIVYARPPRPAADAALGVSLRRRCLLAFAFGLVHGFGFSFALRESLQFAGSHLLAALLSFNAGVELGQIAVLLILVPVLHLTFRHVVAERIGVIVLSALVAHTGWHWMIERGDALRRFRFTWPVLDLVVTGWILSWMFVAAVVGAAAWLTYVAVRAARSGSASARPSSLSARFRR